MEPIFIGKIVVGQVYLWAFVASIILLIAFVAFFKYTKWGLSMQATADDEMAALSLGVNAKVVYALAWAIAFMAAGVGGTLLGNINGLNISVGYLGFAGSCPPWFWADLTLFPEPSWGAWSLESYRIWQTAI